VIKVDLSLLWTIINLVVFYLLLKKFLFKPVMGIMEKREQMIADGLKNASDRQEEAESLKKEYESALSGAKEESVKIVENARVEAKRQSDEILADVKSSEPIKEDGEVLYPGELELKNIKENKEQGIPVVEEVWESVLKM